MIAKKIHKIMTEVDAIGRDTTISSRKTGDSYKVLSSEKVLQLLRPKFIENNLVIFPTAASGMKEGSVTTGQFEYTIIDIEDDERIVVAAIGQGSDTQDKGAGMAMTYAFKNMLLKMFMIITNDDPDMEHSDNIDYRQEELARKKARAEHLARFARSKDMVDDEKLHSFLAALQENASNMAKLDQAIEAVENRIRQNGVEVPE